MKLLTLHPLKVSVNDVYVPAPARQINRVQTGRYSCNCLLTTYLPTALRPQLSFHDTSSFGSIL